MYKPSNPKNKRIPDINVRDVLLEFNNINILSHREITYKQVLFLQLLEKQSHQLNQDFLDNDITERLNIVSMIFAPIQKTNIINNEYYVTDILKNETPLNYIEKLVSYDEKVENTIKLFKALLVFQGQFLKNFNLHLQDTFTDLVSLDLKVYYSDKYKKKNKTSIIEKIINMFNNDKNNQKYTSTDIKDDEFVSFKKLIFMIQNIWEKKKPNYYSFKNNLTVNEIQEAFKNENVDLIIQQSLSYMSKYINFYKKRYEELDLYNKVSNIRDTYMNPSFTKNKLLIYTDLIFYCNNQNTMLNNSELTKSSSSGYFFYADSLIKSKLYNSYKVDVLEDEITNLITNCVYRKNFKEDYQFSILPNNTIINLLSDYLPEVKEDNFSKKSSDFLQELLNLHTFSDINFEVIERNIVLEEKMKEQNNIKGVTHIVRKKI